MRTIQLLLTAALSFGLAACSGVAIDPSPVDTFAAKDYRYYTWRTPPLPATTRSTDLVYQIDPVLREVVDNSLAKKGYVQDAQRAQFSVDYLYAPGLVQGAEPEQASNISRLPSATANRMVDQASVDNAIALGGVKETNNIRLQFNDVAGQTVVWQTTLTKIVENANRVDRDKLRTDLSRYLERAMGPLPDASGK
ncbi:MAG: DUF4136 domain-containing protein [Halioglobus sp.]|nr:DUF4136 domain-containing protein [Halioglobus sp.]